MRSNLIREKCRQFWAAPKSSQFHHIQQSLYFSNKRNLFLNILTIYSFQLQPLWSGITIILTHCKPQVSSSSLPVLSCLLLWHLFCEPCQMEKYLVVTDTVRYLHVTSDNDLSHPMAHPQGTHIDWCKTDLRFSFLFAPLMTRLCYPAARLSRIPECKIQRNCKTINL